MNPADTLAAWTEAFKQAEQDKAAQSMDLYALFKQATGGS